MPRSVHGSRTRVRLHNRRGAFGAICLCAYTASAGQLAISEKRCRRPKFRVVRLSTQRHAGYVWPRSAVIVRAQNRSTSTSSKEADIHNMDQLCRRHRRRTESWFVWMAPSRLIEINSNTNINLSINQHAYSRVKALIHVLLPFLPFLLLFLSFLLLHHLIQT